MSPRCGFSETYPKLKLFKFELGETARAHKEKAARTLARLTANKPQKTK